MSKQYHIRWRKCQKYFYVTHWQKKYPWHFLTSLSLYIFTISKCIAYNFFCRDGIYFDKILVSEYKLFKRSNKANLWIALVQYPVSQMKMTFQEFRIIATGTCIANQLRDVNTICRRSWYIAAHVWKIYDFKIEVVPLIVNFSKTESLRLNNKNQPNTRSKLMWPVRAKSSCSTSGTCNETVKRHEHHMVQN